MSPLRELSRWTAACALALVIGAGHAAAQDLATSDGVDASDVTTDARDLFRRGLALGEENRWADALEYFRRSNALVARASTRFNIGVALGRLGRFVEAITLWDALLAEPDLPEASRAEAIRLRSEATASLGEVTLSIDPPDATLFVDGVERASSPASSRSVPLDPGRHVLRATHVDREEATLEVSVLAGERVRHALTLPTPTLAPALALEVATASDDGDLFGDPVFWIVAGAVVIVIGAGVGIGVGFSESTPPYGGSRGVILVMP